MVDNQAECICPTCFNTRRPVCATDGVQDLNECHLRRQACQGDMKSVAVAKQGPCGMSAVHYSVTLAFTELVCIVSVSMVRRTCMSTYYFSDLLFLIVVSLHTTYKENRTNVQALCVSSYFLNQTRNVAPSWTSLL